MASAIKNLRIDNDSVVYEHIIPRSVRQTWMRRSSVGSFDQDAFPIAISNDLSIDSTDFGSRDAEVEHVGEKDKKLESHHITEEEEIAVFNAWGVKLRHINRKKEEKPYTSTPAVPDSKTSKVCDKDLKEPSKDNVRMNNYNKYAKSNPNRQVDSIPSLPEVVESCVKIRRERPKSMPPISSESLKDLDKEIENGKQKQAPPKAYKSPHSKVPWKRATSQKQSQNKNFNRDNKSTNIVANEKNTSALNVDIKKENVKNIVKQNEIRKNEHISSAKPTNKKRQETFNREALSQGSDREELLSVFKRRKSFEKANSDVGDIDHQDDKHTQSSKKVNEQSTDKSSKQKQLNSNLINNQNDKMNIPSPLSSMIKKDTVPSLKGFNQINLDDLPESEHKTPSNHNQGNFSLSATSDSVKNNTQLTLNQNKVKLESNSIIKMEEFVKNSGAKSDENAKIDSTQTLLDRYQEEPNKITIKNKPEIKSDESNNCNVSGAKDFDSTNQNQFPEPSSNEVLPVTTVKGHKRRVGHLIIQSGDVRERQLKLNNKKSNENGPKSKANEKILEKLPENVKTIEESLIKRTETNQVSEIPITNLDEIFAAKKPKNQSIPVTNLDELPASSECKREKPHLNLSNNNMKSNKEAKEKVHTHIPGKQHYCPIKKVDYNDARQFITPKVYFEKPVGLKSVLSPKVKKDVKKKSNVSFSSGELEKVHMYPSETAAIEMYEEEKSGEKIEDITNIDDVLNISSSDNLASYQPSGLTNLAGTLERERQKLAVNSDIELPLGDDVDGSFDVASSYKGGGDLFTESTTSTANAILF